MPEVTSRWQTLPSKYPAFASISIAETACGAFLPSSSIAIFPHDVLTSKVHVFAAACEAGGADLNCFGFAGGFTVGAGQGLFASAVADTEGVGLGGGATVSVPLSSAFSSSNPPPITKT